MKVLVVGPEATIFSFDALAKVVDDDDDDPLVKRLKMRKPLDDLKKWVRMEGVVEVSLLLFVMRD